MGYKAEHTLAEMSQLDGGSLIATIENDSFIGCVYTGYKSTDDWYDDDIDGEEEFFMDICDKDYNRISTINFKKPETDGELEIAVKELFESQVA